MASLGKESKLLLFLGKLLKERGWVNLGNPTSGHFQKNGCRLYFDFGATYTPAADSFSSLDIENDVPAILQTPEKANWHLEFYGKMLCFDNIPLTCSNAYDNCATERQLKTINELIIRVDAFGNLSTLGKMLSAKNAVKVAVDVDHFIFAETEEEIKIGTFISVLKENNYLIIGRKYQIVGINGTGDLLLCIVDNETQETVPGVVASFEPAALEAFREHKFVSTVEKMLTKKKVSTLQWVSSRFNPSVHPLLSSFDQFHLSQQKTMYLNECLHRGYNFSCFLQPDISREALPLLFQCLVTGIDPMPAVHYSVDKIKYYMQCVTDFSYIPSLFDSNISVDEMTTMLSERFHQHSEIQRTILDRGGDLKFANYVTCMAIMGKDYSFACEQSSIAQVILLGRELDSRLKPSACLLKDYGIVKGDTIIYSFSKSSTYLDTYDIYSFLLSGITCDIKFCSTTCKDIIDDLLEDLRTISFIPGYPSRFIYKSKDYAACRNGNCLTITRATGDQNTLLQIVVLDKVVIVNNFLEGVGQCIPL